MLADRAKVERDIIGACFLSKEACMKSQEIITYEFFESGINSKIYETQIILFEKGVKPDSMATGKELHKNGLIDFVGGLSYLNEIMIEVPTAGGIENDCYLLKEYYIKDETKIYGNNIVKQIENSADILNIIDSAEKGLIRLSDLRIRKSGHLIKDLLHDHLKHIQELRLKDKKISGVPSGYNGLDKMLLGFQDTDLIIIAGRPSMGKTAFSLNLIYNACKAGYRCGFFSVEQSKEQILNRFLAMDTGINSNKIRSGNLTNTELTEIQQGMELLHSFGLLIEDSPELSISDFKALSRRWKLEHKLDIIFVDYLQIMKPEKAHSRAEEVATIARGLKATARLLNIPIVALAQLNRGVEDRRQGKPKLSDLKESGHIEESADIVSFIWRPEKYDVSEYPIDGEKRPTENLACILTEKNRDGAIGKVWLQFEKECTKFNNLEINIQESF